MKTIWNLIKWFIDLTIVIISFIIFGIGGIIVWFLFKIARKEPKKIIIQNIKKG